jgi:GNAT superfamily N-acetyltransferase
MPQTLADGFEVVSLSSDDIEEVFALYRMCRAVTPYGFMADRTKNYYRNIFRRPGDMIGMGLRDGERLVAYSICHRLCKKAYTDCILLSAIDPKTSLVYHGAGYVVHPDYHGRGIGTKMFQLRFQQMAQRQVDHFFGLTAIDNLRSISSVLQAGSLLVGFARDETALNYVVYWGHLCGRLTTKVPPIMVNNKDVKQQKLLFSQRYAVFNLSHRIVSKPNMPHDRDEALFHFAPVE